MIEAGACFFILINTPPPLHEKNVSRLNERIFVIVNASDILFSISGKNCMVLQQDFKERHAAAFMITKIRSFKHERFFFGGGRVDFTVIILYSDVNNRS